MSAEADISVSEQKDTATTKVPVAPSEPFMEKLIRLPVVLPLLTFVLILVVWEAGTRLFAVPSYILPAPSRILGGFEVVSLSRWVEHVWSTLRVALMGFVLAIVVSLPIAVGLAKSRFLSRSLYPLLVVIQSVPVVAVAPIIIVVLGTDDAPRVVITFMITFFPLVVSMTTGLMATPPELIELSRSLRAPVWREISQIRLPYATPYIFSGLKISITLSVIGAVVAEFVAAEKGIGYFIQFSTSMFKLPQAWAGLVVLLVMSLVLFQAVSLTQKILFPWSLPKERK
ncbi:ABC transporter permease [Pseudooceanicola sediminis]|uniref:ABC transporter permease n=1 Tax=Pseudooceanicola sediminis TaxID=2211117 RepID=A0A399J7E4_9RHOB|nr:ABC transporter permease [Pseudooceanicola sediminis]KAA2314231.1 ABC transporter permease [Puniceibacterium sp. HSS470]RII39912.1 ABC transporter permease [Pseudooceanicola sediminis]|tara:strand:- start:71459 stop:72313 length:855 start_codon:yes stop_codon:yes gene_type:complete